MIKTSIQLSGIVCIRPFIALIALHNVLFASQPVSADRAPSASATRTALTADSHPFADGTYTLVPEQIHNGSYTHSEIDVVTGSIIKGSHRFSNSNNTSFGSWNWQGTISRSASGDFIISGEGYRSDNSLPTTTHFTMTGEAYWDMEAGVSVLRIDTEAHADSGFPYGGFGGGGIKPGTPPIKITSAHMISSHTLEMQTRREFLGEEFNVQLSTTINGKEITTTQPLKTSVDINGNVNDTSPIDIDLAAEGVPRFRKNQKFTVEADVLDNTNANIAADKKDAVILLPVVIVPGIDPGPLGGESFGGDGTFHSLEANLKTFSTNKLLTEKLLGDGYSLVGDQTNSALSYPTLYTVSYNRNNSTFAQGSDAISNLVASSIKQRTYADAINLVGHSKGCLVSRKYLATLPQPASVNELIMCQGPHLGSLWALLGINFGYNYRNLFPLWPCVQSVTLTKKSPFIFLPLPSYNTELNDLNHQLLPLDTTYEIIYSTSVPTPYTKSIVMVPGHKPGTIINYTAGDFIVPDFSQRGLLQDPNFPDAPLFRIPAFQSIIGKITEKEIDGSHVTGYMNSEAIGEEVFNQFIGDFQS